MVSFSDIGAVRALGGVKCRHLRQSRDKRVGAAQPVSGILRRDFY